MLDNSLYFNSEGPPLQEVSIVFARADLRNKASEGKDISKLALDIV